MDAGKKDVDKFKSDYYKSQRLLELAESTNTELKKQVDNVIKERDNIISNLSSNKIALLVVETTCSKLKKEVNSIEG